MLVKIFSVLNNYFQGFFFWNNKHISVLINVKALTKKLKKSEILSPYIYFLFGSHNIYLFYLVNSEAFSSLSFKIFGC